MCSVHVSWNWGIYSFFSNPSSFQVKQQNCISLWTKTLPKAFLVARKRWSLEPTCTSNIHWLTYYQQMLWIHCLHQHQWQLPAKSQGQPLVWRNSLKKLKRKASFTVHEHVRVRYILTIKCEILSIWDEHQQLSHISPSPFPTLPLQYNFHCLISHQILITETLRNVWQTIQRSNKCKENKYSKKGDIF